MEKRNEYKNEIGPWIVWLSDHTHMSDGWFHTHMDDGWFRTSIYIPSTTFDTRIYPKQYYNIFWQISTEDATRWRIFLLLLCANRRQIDNYYCTRSIDPWPTFKNCVLIIYERTKRCLKKYCIIHRINKPRYNVGVKLSKYHFQVGNVFKVIYTSNCAFRAMLFMTSLVLLILFKQFS